MAIHATNTLCLVLRKIILKSNFDPKYTKNYVPLTIGRVISKLSIEIVYETKHLRAISVDINSRNQQIVCLEI